MMGNYHTNYSMEEFKCLICGKTFKNKVGLGTHIVQYEHVPMEQYYLRFFPEDCVCPVCGKQKKWSIQKFNKTCGDPACVKAILENTNLERYGNKCSLHGKEVEEKVKAKLLERYGSENWTTTDSFKDKSRETKLKKYGDPTYVNRDKAKQTCVKRYGVEYPMQNNEILSKSKNTCLQKYGGWWVQSEQIRAYRFQNFKHDGFIFNSNDEILFYDFCKAQNLNIQVHDIDPIVYFDDLGNRHLYFPDFKLEGRLIEIKGDQFFDESNNLTNPYTDDPDLLNVYKCKGICMTNNNVLVIRASEVRSTDILKNILIKEKLL